ncbi:hypothetical protein B0I08_106321 [Glaciihabitans tibetensis]|uniref:Mce-associated membrane protein n=1 Tax=Glaciihabitans tibetensis TaxID=1266600 RepID=A0A2T0VC38_9MICO|nr:hypothetical protein B0I08_106321 [Glaciihabitans tibetensis]
MAAALVAALVIALVAVLGLSAAGLLAFGPADSTATAPLTAGSTPGADSSDTATTSSPAPLFASDEEALAAASAAYAAFLDATDSVIADGGAAPERIDEFATPDVARFEKEGVQRFVENGYQLAGRSRLTAAQFQSHSVDARGSHVATIYACVDISEVDVFNAKGESVVAPDRSDQTAFEVTFTQSPEDRTRLIVMANDVWEGGGICRAS